ncbi:MAG: flavin reductase family protein [Roseobacter sp.]
MMDKPVKSFEPTAEHSHDLRRALGCFGTGVTVVTALSPIGPLGMTANSFSSVSLDPPLVLWSPAKGSQRHDAFVNAPQFCIHILADHQLKLAQHFATNGVDFGEFEWAAGPDGAPSFVGCVAQFHCDTHAVHPAGDHSIIIGRIRHVVQENEGAPGLLFKQGRFGSFSPHPKAD